MFHWKSAGGSCVGAEEGTVLAGGAVVVLGASSLGVLVVSNLTFWR